MSDEYDYYDDENIKDPYEEEIQEENEEDEKQIFHTDHFLNKILSKPKGKMYFDEEYVKGLIINEYQPYLVYEINEKGKRVCVDRSAVSRKVEKEIMSNLFLIANAIINKYRFWRFDTVEELQAEALRAMWVYLPNFIPGKGTVFNLFSLICKKDLLNFTLKGYKDRITADIDTCYDISYNKEFDYNSFFDNLEGSLFDIINKNFLRDKRKKYIELASILLNYIKENQKIVGKNDLLSEFKSFGYKSTEYKKFIEEISVFRDEIQKSVLS